MITRTASLLLLLLCSIVAQASTQAAFSADYIITDGKPAGKRTLDLSVKDKQYTLSATTEAAGFLAMLNPHPVVESSKGVIVGGQVKPGHYQRIDKNNPDKNLDLVINWKSSKVFNKTSPREINYAIAEHTQDQLSETLMLMVSPPGNEPRKLDITFGSRPKYYMIAKLGEEQISTAAGNFKTIKYRRDRIGKNDRYVLIWCAPELGNLPVKIEKHKQGKVVSMFLEAYREK